MFLTAWQLTGDEDGRIRLTHLNCLLRLNIAYLTLGFVMFFFQSQLLTVVDRHNSLPVNHRYSHCIQYPAYGPSLRKSLRLHMPQT